MTERLNAEFGTSFVGSDPAGWCRIVEPVPREGQDRAIACHASQSSDNPILRRRLQLLSDREYVRVLGCPEPQA
ncbi:hypothetical protein [Streptomyces sp. MAI_2237]